LSGTFAALIAGVALSAQAPGAAGAQQNPTQPAAGTEPRAAAATTTTLTGCVYKEADIPGRTPNVAEKAGVLEDYILADARPVAAAGAAGAPSATGTSGSAGSMYKLEQIADERLKAVVGKRVEVMGKIDAETSDRAGGAPAADKSLGPDKVNLPEFEVTSMKEVSGACPARPAAR
jgi:hypothetical protein